MLKIYLLGLLLLATLLSGAAAQGERPRDSDDDSGIIYGADHAFVLSAPAGWVLDNTSGVSQGLHAVFYPKGSTWKDSPVVMYTNVVSKKSEKDTLESIIEADIAAFKQQSPGIKITDAETVAAGDSSSIHIKHFAGGESHNYEAVAYIGESKVVVMLVLSSKTKRGFDDALPAFNKLISSYHFLGGKVVTKK